jgi:glutamate-1-semialdehyde 2,1-aminomutase
LTANGKTLSEAFSARTPASQELALAAAKVLPSGVSHDLRYQEPHPIYIEKALGPRKWDVDGNEYIDYIGGHGALILGHSYPEIVGVVEAQAKLGTHPGAAHQKEVEWAEKICDLVPSAERVRFTSSGTEATLMALRLARAFTGRTKILQFAGHFHGWQDHVVTGYEAPSDNAPPPGILPAIVAENIIVEAGDPAMVEAAFAQNQDIAAIIVEPTGAHFGATPLRPEFLKYLREITSEHQCLLIFDEVVTGFRVAPGGMQELAGVIPDLTTLGKIVAGGLPGGAVAGRLDIMSQLDFQAAREAGQRKISHPGTFNANPMSAVTGSKALEIIGGSDICTRVNEKGANFRQQLNQVLADLKLDWAVYGSYSGFHLFTNSQNRGIDPLSFEPAAIPFSELTENDTNILAPLRLALLLNGVDTSPRFSGFLSASHSNAEIDQTAAAFRRALELLIEEGIVKVS